MTSRHFVQAVALLCCTVVVSVNAQPSTMSVAQVREASVNSRLILVDIRTPREWQESGIPDVAIPLDMTQKGFVDKLLALREAQPNAQLGLICATGGRSKFLTQWLRRNAVAGVVDVPAGMHTHNGWLANELPVKAYQLEEGS